MRILIVEDDPLITTSLAALLKKLYVVDSVCNAESAQYLVDINEYDLIILDIGLPDKSGVKLCSEWRALEHLTPILFLTASHEYDDLLTSFQVGGDDYLTKPFRSSELLCRVQALIKRSGHFQPQRHTLNHCWFSSSSKQLSDGKSVLQLNCKEGQLLELLLRHRGSIVTRSMIIEHVWENTDDMATNTIEVHIGRLRRKMLQAFKLTCIKTIRNVGYLIAEKRISAVESKGGEKHDCIST
jgi:two-component system, OmpR family, response regulator